MRPSPTPELARGGPQQPPATGLPEAALALDGLVPRHEISATTCPWESHPSEPQSATAPRPSTHREPARWGDYIPARRCIPACRPTRRPRACISRRDAASRVSPRLRRRDQPRLYRLESIPSRARSSLVRRGDVHFLSFLE